MIFHENCLLADVSHGQTFLMKHHTLFLSEIGKDVAKFVVCCSLECVFFFFFSFIERQNFLQRTDLRQFEIERSLRLSSSSKR